MSVTDNEKKRAERNRTITLDDPERIKYGARLVKLAAKAEPEEIIDRTINQDLFDAIDYLPDGFVDLLFVDPPYNLTKTFNGKTFN